MNPLHNIHLIDSGKQVGASLDTTENGVCYHNSIGIQRWQDKFRVNICRIAYDNMASERFEVDEVVEFVTLDDALNYVASQSCVPIETLDVCKGQKIFSPTHLYSEGRLREPLETTMNAQ